MSLYVSCQCGQAFNAPPKLAGKTLPCPACKQPLTVPAAAPAPEAADLAPAGPTPLAANDPFVTTGQGSQPLGAFAMASPLGGPAPAASPLGGAPGLGNPGLGADPFAGSMGMQQGAALGSMSAGVNGAARGPQQPQLVRGQEDSPLVVWLSIGGGGLALVCVVGFLIYNATQKASTSTAATPTPPPAAPVATTPANTTPATTPTTPSTTTPATTTPMPMATPMPLPAATPPTFTPPAHGQLVGSLSGEYAVWFANKPSAVPDGAGLLGGFDPAAMFGDVKPLKSQIAMSTSESFETAGFAELQMPVPVGPALLDQLQASAAKQFGDGQATTNKIKHLGRDAVEVTTERELLGMKNLIRVVAFAEGNSIFALFWMGSANGAATEDVKTFFASFHKRPPNAPELPPLAAFAFPGLPGLPGSGQEKSPGEWSFTNADGSGGSMKQQPDGKWLETRSDNSKFTFTEVSRSDKFVELTDASRNLSIRLHDDRLEWKAADGQWTIGPAGKWVKKPSDAVAGAGGSEFSRLVLGGGEFEIVVPGAALAPREKKRIFLTPNVRGDELKQIGSTPDGGTDFSVTQYELPEDVNDELLAAKKALDFTTDIKYEEQKIKVAGLDAWQFDWTLADGAPTRKIMFGKGRYFFEIQISGKPNSAAGRQFLASFRKLDEKSAEPDTAASELEDKK